MNPYQFKISLRLRHPSADPAEITAALGLEPKVCGRAGESRSTPKGNPLEGRNQDSYWTAEIAEGRWPGKRLSAVVGGLLDQLAARKDFLHQVRAEGGKVEFFVGWFFDGDSGDVFGYDLLRRMAELKIDLSLCIYPPDRS